MKILIWWKNICNQTMNWNQTMKLCKININNTVLHWLKENKFVETHKNLGVNEMVKGFILIPWNNPWPIISVVIVRLTNHRPPLFPYIKPLAGVNCSNFWFPKNYQGCKPTIFYNRKSDEKWTVERTDRFWYFIWSNDQFIVSNRDAWLDNFVQVYPVLK